ncbi:hypothetical protein SLE2022_334220 [Rubroshorea leprosula]
MGGPSNSKDKKKKAKWDARATRIFCDVCVEEVAARNRPCNTFNRTGWANVIAKFNERANRNYSYKQLRNRWDGLKKDWILWKQLLSQATGLGLNQKGTIDASHEWWAAMKKENPNYTKFEEFGLENPKEMEIMFSKAAATGEIALTPAADNLFPEQDAVDLDEGSGDSDDVNSIPTQSQPIISNEKRKKTTIDCSIPGNEKQVTPSADNHFPEQDLGVQGAIDLDERSNDSDDMNYIPTQNQPIRSNGKRKKTVPNCSIPGTEKQVQKGKGKKAKMWAAIYMQRQLNHFCDAVESYNSHASLTESSKKNYDSPGSSIADCMGILKNLPGVEVGGELYMLGTRLFMKRDYREMFACIPTADVKLSWLKQELRREVGSAKKR